MKTDPLPDMLPRQLPEPAGGTVAGLPRPRHGARWRWSTRRRALVAGGAMATVLGLGASGAGAATSSNGPSTGAHGRPPVGAGRPVLMGKITAISGSDVSVRTRSGTTTTVVVSSSTTYETMAGPGATSKASAAALKVGGFIGVRGTKNSDGTVIASSVVLGGSPSGGPGGRLNGARPPAATPAA